MFIRDKVQFQDLRSGRIFLGQATKLYILKSQSSEVKHDSALTSNVEFATFHIETEPCLTETKCNFRTFGVNESFWTKQQSCITLKVSLRKWCPFFVFVCFSGCHFTQDGFTKKDNVQKIFFEFLHVFLTFLHNICFFQRHVLPLPFLSQNSRCA